MSLRLILAIIGVLILVAIIWDGYRHWRKTSGFSLADKFKIKDYFNKPQQSTPTPARPLDDAPEMFAQLKIDDIDDAPAFNTAATTASSIVDAPQAAPAASTVASNQAHTVIVLHVLAQPGEHFSGDDLRVKFQSQRLFFGDLKLFHKHENDDAKKPTLFSLANALEPGQFDLSTLDSFTTSGVALFLQLPGEFNAQLAFEQMYETAQSLAKRLNARLCDHHRQPLTEETLQRYINQVALYTN